MPAPIRVVLRMNRAARAADPLAGAAEPTEYIRQLPDAIVEVAVLDWPRLVGQLQALVGGRTDPQAARHLGSELQSFLAQMPSWTRDLDLGLGTAASGAGLELVLSFDAAELYVLPWELVVPAALRRRLGEDPRIRFRYAWPGALAAPERPSPRPAGGRVLLAWSATGGPVPWREHRDAIALAAVEGHQDFDPTRDVVDRASLDTIVARLREASAREGASYAALHLLCHGAARDGAFGVMLDRAAVAGDTELVNAERLRSALAPFASSLRLVVLAACNSGGSPPFGNQLGSLAQVLHAEGIEAVVASRMPLSVRGSIVITAALYRALMVSLGSVEDAVAAARSAAVSAATSEDALDWAALQLFAARPVLGDLRPFVVRPYRGLLAFTAQDSRFFHGREAEVSALVERVREAVAGDRPRLQILSGASGSGKSSLVLAGVVPRLISAEPAQRWELLVIRPSDQGGGLATLLRGLRALRARLPLGAASAPPARPSRGDLLREALLLTQDCSAWVLIVLDQTEEIFTQLDRQEREELMGALWELSRLDGARVVILSTLRVDFFGHCGDVLLDEQGTRFDRLTLDPRYSLGVSQVDLQQIATIIEEPARSVGLSFEDGLVADILDELGREVTALPLLEYALDELWKRREGPMLTRKAYQDLGGFRGALARTADRVLAEMPRGEVTQTRLLLVQAVLAGGPLGGDSRRRVWLRDLARDDAQQRRDLDDAVRRLVDSRLLVRGDDDPAQSGGGVWVEVAHEALIRSWQTLRGWLAEDRRMYEQLESIDSSWRSWERARSEGGDTHGFLLQGGALVLAQEALDTWAHAMRQPVREYVLLSLRERDRRVRASQARARRFTLFMALVAVIMLGVSLYALQQKGVADENAKVSAKALSDLLKSKDALDLSQREQEKLIMDLRAKNTELNDKQTALEAQEKIATDNAERAESETARAIEALKLAGVDTELFERASRFELEMQTFSPGTFSMGSPDDEPGREPDEVAHTVRITRPFEISVTEVTQLEWVAVMGTRPFQFKGMANRPAEMVSWYDALAFCNALSLGRGLEPCYDVRGTDVLWTEELDCEGYRLPTESEWEYAARGHGRPGSYPVAGDFSDLEIALRAQSSTADAYGRGMLSLTAWTFENSGAGTHPVGLRVPNSDGLYDTLGNVWEWVWDVYAAYPGDDAEDPLGPLQGPMRVARGGSWWYQSAPRLAMRGTASPGERQDGIGFRVARTLER